MGSSHSYDSNGDDAFTAKGRRKRSIIVERQNEFPQRIRCAIKSANRRTKNPKVFLLVVRNALADWLFEIALSTTVTITSDNDNGNCYGLDDEIDTQKQVELALRFFPEVLCLRRYGLFPIFWLSKSIRSVSFIPLFARLGVELQLFQESERGGLVFGSNGMDVFSQLAASCAENKRSDEDQQEVVDAKYLAVIKKLRKYKLMKKSDICKYDMIDILCKQAVFPEKRFRYLIDWNPSALLSNNGNSKIISIRLITKFFDKKDISGLKMLFELSMKYFPVEIGFLFDTFYSVDGETLPSSFRKKKARSSFSKKNTSSKRRGLLDDSEHTRESRDGSGHRRVNKAFFENETSLYQFACEVYGTKKAQDLIDSMMYAQMNKDPNFTRKALIHAASSGDTEEDGAQTMFLLLQRDPTIIRTR